MGYGFGKFDKTASFFATSTSKVGKKEIKISPIQKDADEIKVSDTLDLTFELAEEQDVAGFEWIYANKAANGKSKRSHSSNNGSNQQDNQDAYLAVALKEGKILILSPFQKEVVNEITTDIPINSLASASHSFWVSGAKLAEEYTLNGSKPNNTIVYPEDHKQVASIHTLQYNSKNYIVSGGRDKVIVIDESTGKVFAELSNPDDKTKQSISTIVTKNETIFTVKQNSTTVSAFSLISQELLYTLEASSPIISLFIVENIIGAVTKYGNIELFVSALSGLSTEVTSVISPSAPQVRFLSAISHNSKLLLSWIDIIPKFRLISTKGLPLEHEVDVQFVGKQRSTFKALEPVTVDLERVESYSVRDVELAGLIESKSNEPTELLKVLISNEEADKVKYAVSKLSNAHVLRIFKILGPRVQSNPTESAALNTWLKWVIIRHSDGITDSTDLKPLRVALKKELRQLPNLLSLQGRLELLQSQLQLRSEISSFDVEEDDEIPSELVAKAEENIVYINGENDDGDDVIEAAGNSESGEEDEDDEINVSTANGTIVEDEE